jgi:uncharacterized OB-fold protein
MSETFVAEHALEYPGGYTRSVGPVLGRFMTALRDGRILGVKGRDGRVIVPPQEYDPVTSEAIGESAADFVEVGPAGRVLTWSWVATPRVGKHPLDRPFAFALISLDGADTALLHAVDCGTPDGIVSGVRVAPRWRSDRVGKITDIECFTVLADGEQPVTAPARTNVSEDDTEEGDVTAMNSAFRLEYKIPAGAATRRYLNGLAQGKIIGGRAPSSTDVYAASRGTDPKTGEPTSIEVEISDTGCITTYCVVNIPGLSELAPEVPFVSAQILLDGADNMMFGLIRGCDVDDVHMGMRVRAKWADELKADHRSILYWEPTGETDAPYDHYKDNL